MDARTQQLISAPPLPLLIRMATPNSIAFLIQSCVSLAEVWFIGRLGTVSLAAIALVFPLLMLSQTLSGGALGGAVTSAIARRLGAGEAEEAERLIWHALAMAAMGSASLLILYLLLGRPFLVFLGGTGSALAEAHHYALLLLSGAFTLWCVGTLSAVFRGMGDMQFPARLMILNAAIQVPFSGGLILGIGGLPALGILGAAISAVVSAAIVASVMLISLAGHKHAIRLRVDRMQFSRYRFKTILDVFLPASLSPILTISTIISLTAIVGRFGPEALAGYGIGSRIEFLMIPLVFGLGAAMTALVGLSVGAGNIARAEHIGRIGGSLAFLLAGAVGIGLALFPGAWIPRFSENPLVIDAATSYIQTVGPAYAFLGLGLSLYFASQGAGAMLWPVAATVLRILLAVGGALLLAYPMELGLDGVFYAAAIAMAVYGIMIALAVARGAWRNHQP